MVAYRVLLLTAALTACTAEAAPQPEEPEERAPVEVTRSEPPRPPQRSLRLPTRAFDEASGDLV